MRPDRDATRKQINSPPLYYFLLSLIGRHLPIFNKTSVSVCKKKNRRRRRRIVQLQPSQEVQKAIDTQWIQKCGETYFRYKDRFKIYRQYKFIGSNMVALISTTAQKWMPFW